MILDSAAIVKSLADSQCERVTNKAIRWLQSLKGDNLLSGDDSELENAWDEICVQVQNEESFYWHAYVLTMRQGLESALFGINQDVLMAIWLQTDTGYCWDAEEDGEPDSVESDVVDYLMSEYLIPKAEKWSNKRIVRYINNYS